MPAALRLSAAHMDDIERFVADLVAAGRTPWRQTVQAARTACGRIERAGGLERMSTDQQLEVLARAPTFAAWLMVSGRLRASAELVDRANLRLGVAARNYLPVAHRWFVQAAEAIGVSAPDISAQWSTLAKVTALSGVAPDAIGEVELERARLDLVAAFTTRATPEAGRGLAASFHRLRLTLYHAGRLAGCTRPAARDPVSLTGWARVAQSYAQAAQRYIAQVRLSLRPSTVSHIEQTLREFGRWLAEAHPQVAGCAELAREHIEQYKAWLHATPRPRAGGRPLNRSSIKNRLINLRCFFERITEWGYPDVPRRPLIYMGDLPILDKPLPRFLDDAAAAKLLRRVRQDPDPLARLVVELLARTGIRVGELLALRVDAVVQIGSAFWLRIPVGKLHSDRYIPLHPDLKALLDGWVAEHRPSGLRGERLLVERGRPITRPRVAGALSRLASEAGIGHVTPHQLRHTLATQAINRGMSLDAIAALLGHKTLAMTMIYARIADRTVAEQYFAVTEKVEALYGQARTLPADQEGSEMRRLRAEVNRRMLGNGYCARPVEMDCHFESICESCTFFVTTHEFRPTLERQREDAHAKGQIGRQRIFDGLLERLSESAS